MPGSGVGVSCVDLAAVRADAEDLGAACLDRSLLGATCLGCVVVGVFGFSVVGDLGVSGVELAAGLHVSAVHGQGGSLDQVGGDGGALDRTAVPVDVAVDDLAGFGVDVGPAVFERISKLGDAALHQVVAGGGGPIGHGEVVQASRGEAVEEPDDLDDQGAVVRSVPDEAHRHQKAEHRQSAAGAVLQVQSPFEGADDAAGGDVGDRVSPFPVGGGPRGLEVDALLAGQRAVGAAGGGGHVRRL